MKAKKKVPTKKSSSKSKAIKPIRFVRLQSCGIIHLGGDQEAIYTMQGEMVTVQFTAPPTINYSEGNTRRITYNVNDFIKKYGARL